MIRLIANPIEAPQQPESMATDSDQLLIHRAKSGCHVAFGNLVRNHQGVVRAVLGRYLRDDNEVDELAQRVFVAAYRSLNSYRGDAKFSSWLVAIARHQVAMYVRSETRRRKRESRVAEMAIAEWVSQTSASLERTDEKLDALSECLKQLPGNSRDVIQRFYFERETVDSIAQRQDRSSGAIRMMLMRIRKTLANCVSNRLSMPEKPK